MGKIINKYLILLCIVLPIKGFAQNFSSSSMEQRTIIAKNMLLYQRSNGGWPKHIKEVKIDYSKPLDEEQLAIVKENYLSSIDATIDNNATIKEIRFLIAQFKSTKEPQYLDAVEKGISYLLISQYPNGGWPQYYPDKRIYRHYITYNDNAMVNVLNLLQDVSEGKQDLDLVNRKLISGASSAVKKGIDCILKTQIKVDGELTVWCAQHDELTFKPANARAFELASLSGSESVGIVQFLMSQKNPSPAIKQSIINAVNWFKKTKIEGFNVQWMNDPVNGRDRVLVKDENSVLWARFYEIGTNEPFFVGRDGVKKKSMSEIEAERRNGYAWYGTWPLKLISQDYPAWAAINLKDSNFTK